jgi:hypothetical protein
MPEFFNLPLSRSNNADYTIIEAATRQSYVFWNVYVGFGKFLNLMALATS